MYVCLCQGVTDSAIRNEIRNGATSFREIRDRLKVGTQCGKCVCSARELIADNTHCTPAPVNFYEASALAC